MSLAKCPNCKKDFINTNNKCIYCGYLINEMPSNNGCFSISDNVLIGYNGTDKNVIIPDNIIEIANDAFLNNMYIENVTFSNNTRVIGESAFENCCNLVKITNYGNIEYYKKNCFRNCGLIELEITENVKEIGENAFFENNNLIRINYHPNKNLNIKRSFAKCSKLEDVIMNQKYFYPSFGPNERGDGRPTFFDAFWNTPFNIKIKNECIILYKKKICPDCGGRIKGIFNKRCSKCHIYYRRFICQ